MLVKDLKFEEDELEWNYNVPKGLRFTFKNDINCRICLNDEVKSWSGPYIYAGVPTERLISIFKEHFSLEVTEKEFEEHKTHIKTQFMGYAGIKDRAIEDMSHIESDIVNQVDEKKVLESTIRSLYARKLYLESMGDYGRDYCEIVKQLKSCVELKLKMKNELVDETIKISVDDIIKLGISNGINATAEVPRSTC